MHQKMYKSNIDSRSGEKFSQKKGTNQPDTIWDKVFTLSENANGEQFTLDNENLTELKNTYIGLMRERDDLLKEKKESPGPIYSLMVSQMNGFIKRNKRRLSVLKDKH